MHIYLIFYVKKKLIKTLIYFTLSVIFHNSKTYSKFNFNLNIILEKYCFQTKKLNYKYDRKFNEQRTNAKYQAF